MAKSTEAHGAMHTMHTMQISSRFYDLEREQGAFAYIRGVPSANNPYRGPLAEEEARGWSKGWWEAREAMMEYASELPIPTVLLENNHLEHINIHFTGNAGEPKIKLIRRVERDPHGEPKRGLAAR